MLIASKLIIPDIPRDAPVIFPASYAAFPIKIDDTIKISKNLFKKTDLTDFLITSATFIFVANPIRRDNSCKNIVAKIDKIIAQIKE